MENFRVGKLESQHQYIRNDILIIKKKIFKYINLSEYIPSRKGNTVYVYRVSRTLRDFTFLLLSFSSTFQKLQVCVFTKPARVLLRSREGSNRKFKRNKLRIVLRTPLRGRRRVELFFAKKTASREKGVFYDFFMTPGKRTEKHKKAT